MSTFSIFYQNRTPIFTTHPAKHKHPGSQREGVSADTFLNASSVSSEPLLKTVTLSSHLNVLSSRDGVIIFVLSHSHFCLSTCLVFRFRSPCVLSRTLQHVSRSRQHCAFGWPVATRRRGDKRQRVRERRERERRGKERQRVCERWKRERDEIERTHRRTDTEADIQRGRGRGRATDMERQTRSDRWRKTDKDRDRHEHTDAHKDSETCGDAEY